jgi:RNA polymerase sigma factor (sigma-70 family)
MTVPATTRVPRDRWAPAFVRHPSFDLPDAAWAYAPEGAGVEAAYRPEQSAYMPDEVTRDYARRMHYAAFRAHAARGRTAPERWHRAYLRLRDDIVLGNRKLVYRAVRQRGTPGRSEDTIGDCHVVLIQAVAAFNPWLMVRFSTYAYTCLLRSIARKARRSAGDLLGRALALDCLPDGEPTSRLDAAPARASSGSVRIEEFLRDDHPLLSAREKSVIARRFSLTESGGQPTLEAVGTAVGLSKERVRQVQAAAIGKLRQALAPHV